MDVTADKNHLSARLFMILGLIDLRGMKSDYFWPSYDAVLPSNINNIEY